MVNDVSLDAVVSYVADTSRPTLIVFHERPDGDAVGSAFGLKLLIDALGGKSYCISGDEIPERLRFLTNGIQESVLVTSLPCGFENARVVSVDCGSASQVGRIYELYTPTLSIDHHGSSQRFCDGLTNENAAATAEIIFDIAEVIIDSGKISAFPKRFAECIYAAISSDTGCFRFSNATPATHLRAAKLLSQGIDASDINHRLFSSKTKSTLIAEAAAVKKMRSYNNGRISVVAFNSDEIRDLCISRENFDAFIEVARSLEGADVAISVRRADGDTVCRISMRSSANINVADICAVFGGGGHVRAAGCSIDTEDVEEAVSLIVSETEKAMRKTGL